MESKIEYKVTGFRLLSSVKDSLKIGEIIKSEAEKNLVYFTNGSSKEFVLIYDVNSNSNNIPFFIRSALLELFESNLEYNLNKIEEATVILLKDPTNLFENPKNSIVLTLSILKLNEENASNLRYLKKESLQKSLKTFDLKSNFNPST